MLILDNVFNFQSNSHKNVFLLFLQIVLLGLKVALGPVQRLFCVSECQRFQAQDVQGSSSGMAVPVPF